MSEIMEFANREEFRRWLFDHCLSDTGIWLLFGKAGGPKTIKAGEALEEALCFGWIDTTHKRINGVDMQRFTPRTKRSQWSGLNKERCRRLERLGLMTDAGRKELPDMSEASFKIDQDIQAAFDDHPQAWQNFQSFPKLYQRVRIDSIQRDKKKDRAVFDKRLAKLIDQSEQGKMFGEWNDYGRLL